VISAKEPFQKLRNVGLILAHDGQKMSKSKGNVVSPNEIIEEFGADTLRVYEMFMGPFDQAIAWNPQGVKGVSRFLNKTWDLILECKDNQKSSKEIISETNKLIKKVGEDLEKMKFNTCIAFFMEYVNFVSERKSDLAPPEIELMLKIFTPFAPHFCEELWNELGNKNIVVLENWPPVDEAVIIQEKTVLVVQVNGKVRDKIEIAMDISKEEVLEAVKQSKKIKQWLFDGEIKDIVFVPNKIINILVK
jgi:leucyl-tRNA synthetase